LQGLEELAIVGRANIGMKRMGELDLKAFGIACRKKVIKRGCGSHCCSPLFKVGRRN